MEFQVEHVLCSVCGVDDCKPVAVGADFEYQTSDEEFMAVQCCRCDLVYLNPRPDTNGLRLAYPANYHAFEFNANQFGVVYKVRQRLEAKRLLRWCKGLPQDARILDIGCGDGFHIELLKMFGSPTWTVEGLDCDPRAVSGAERRGLKIMLGAVEDLTIDCDPYDLILMIMTIEHVTDPKSMLNAVARLLKPGGKLVIVTDNTTSPDFRIFGNRHWGGYHFPRHLSLFNKRNLGQLCRQAGLTTESIKTAVSPVNWTYSFRNWIHDWNGPRWLRDQLSLESPVALALFTLVDIPLSMIGRGAILQGVFVKDGAK